MRLVLRSSPSVSVLGLAVVMGTPVASGLTQEQARARLAEVGRNVLAEPKRPSAIRRFAANLVHLFAVLLWIGAALAFVGGLPELTAAILVVILVNAVFAFVQESRAERASEALRRVLPRTARVRRGGEEYEVSAEELVPGDVVLLAPGDRISRRRGRVTVTSSGSTTPRSRGVRPVAPERLVYAGTRRSRGGRAVVVATGMSTEFGRIAELTQQAEDKPSPLELELRHVTRVVAVVSFGLGSLFFVVAGFLGMGLEERFVFAIGVTVANVPEGLLPTVTLSLALGTQRMAKRNALVRRLSRGRPWARRPSSARTRRDADRERDDRGAHLDACTRLVRGRRRGLRAVRPLPADGNVAEPPAAARTPPLRAPLQRRSPDDRPRQASTSSATRPRVRSSSSRTRAAFGMSTKSVAPPPVAGDSVRLERKRMSTVHLLGDRRLAYRKGAAEVLLPRTTLAGDGCGGARRRGGDGEIRVSVPPSPAGSSRETGRSRTTSNVTSSSWAR